MYKKWIFPAGLAVAGLLIFFLYQKYQVAPSINLKTLDLSDLEGNKVTMESLKGEKILLSFGASWCGNCWHELKDLNDISGTDLSDVKVIVVSDETPEKIMHFKEKGGFPFTFLKMNVPFSAIGINSIPTSYVINTKLEVKKETVGYIDWKDPSTCQHLKKLME
ncbi:MAG: TlpA family protein disulfide reductase [Bacteroidia bacterium]|nr:TlpA family protein disulfide reductase [Bacteroidia bacterium]